MILVFPFRTCPNRLFLLRLCVLYYDIQQADRAVFHLVNQTLDEAKNVVVEQLKNDSDDQTEQRGQQSHLDTTGNNGSRDITYLLDLIECSDHTDDGTQESQRRSDRDEQRNPAQVLLEQTELYATVARNGLLNYVDTLVVAAQTLIEDRCHRPRVLRQTSSAASMPPFFRAASMSANSFFVFVLLSDR